MQRIILKDFTHTVISKDDAYQHASIYVVRTVLRSLQSSHMHGNTSPHTNRPTTHQVFLNISLSLSIVRAVYQSARKSIF